jgi:sterol desaturase/sphingolipid hydroxylase (fatty acid hydroxylase superfamily)
MQSLLQLEGQIRLFSFLGIFALMALWEAIQPYRQLRFSRLQRWPHQLGLIVLNSIILRVLFPTAAAGSAMYAQQNGLGLMQLLGFNLIIASLIGFIFLDFAIYWQHIISHKLNWFWKLHRTHHADTDYDLTTGLRFHPLEIIISMLIKIVLIILAGIPLPAVILFEVVLSGSAMFNHSNIALPKQIDAILKKIIVTPTMHRIHHSTHRFEHDSNYGFFLSIWDHWFDSYTEKASEDDRLMPIGLSSFRDRQNAHLPRILAIPFRK